MNDGQKFLARYYFANIIRSKIGGALIRACLARSASGWAMLRERYRGEHSWLVVGNGPSLAVEDLEALGHLPSIASNKINLLFKRTAWRPTLYTISDNLVLFKLPQEHYDDFDMVLVPETGYFMARTEKLLPFRSVTGKARSEWFGSLEDRPDPVSTGFLDGNTVTAYNIQIALWLGARSIYLIGCDPFYNEAKHSGVRKLAHEATASNHFDPNYRRPGEIVNSAPIQKLEEGYTAVRQLAERFDARVINVTRRTALTTFELANVEDVVLCTNGSGSGAAQRGLD